MAVKELLSWCVRQSIDHGTPRLHRLHHPDARAVTPHTGTLASVRGYFSTPTILNQEGLRRYEDTRASSFGLWARMRPGVPFAGVRMSCAGGEFGRRQCRACWGMRSVSHSPVSIFLGPPVVPMRKELAGQAYPAGYVSGRACGFSRPRSCAMGVSRICRSGCRPLWVCASTPFRAQPGDMPVFRGWGSKGVYVVLFRFFYTIWKRRNSNDL